MSAEALGWIGNAALLAAYLMISRGRIAPTSGTYLTLNLVGAALCGSSSVLYGAWPTAVANAVWAAVGFYTLFKALRSRGTSTAPLSQNLNEEPMH